MVNKFDAELSRHLQPVAAPEALWERIQEGRGPQPVERARWPLWAFAAALAAMVALCCFSLRSDTTSYMAQLAARDLTGGSELVDFRSSDAAAIRAWVKANAGLDIPLPAEHSVRLIGVSLIREGGPAACISYRIGNREGRLVVARGASAAPQHRSMEHVVDHGTALASWVMHGQTYALASAPQDLRAACVLCHAEGRAGRKPAGS
jgi:hypothetical protein